MLRLRCALWLWLTTVAPALSFTLAPFTQRPRPSTTRIFSDEVDDVEFAPNDDECVANLSDDDYSDDAGALEVIDDDAPDLTKLAQKNKLTKASWKLSLSIGRETGTWMPEEWAASGARLLLPITVEFDSEPYPGEPEALVGQTCFRARARVSHPKTPSTRDPHRCGPSASQVSWALAGRSRYPLEEAPGRSSLPSRRRSPRCCGSGSSFPRRRSGTT